MKGFLIDENLPGRLTIVPSLPVVSSSRALQRSADDSELWEFAQARELAIVTKDADFSDRILASAPPQSAAASVSAELIPAADSVP